MAIRQRVSEQWRSLAANQNAYRALILAIAAGGILLMVLPSELITYKPAEKPEINLKITFSDLSSQGWLALAFTVRGLCVAAPSHHGAITRPQAASLAAFS